MTPGLPLGPQPYNHFCLGCEPKARVAIIWVKRLIREIGRRCGTLRANTKSDVQMAQGMQGSQIIDRLMQMCWADKGFPSSCAKKGRLSQPHFGAKCENAIHTPKSGDLESSGTPENLEDNLRGQISSPWCVFYINGKLLKCRCPKWPRMGHLDL